MKFNDYKLLKICLILRSGVNCALDLTEQAPKRVMSFARFYEYHDLTWYIDWYNSDSIGMEVTTYLLDLKPGL